MSRHICMTPSNTLSSTDASKFALKIIEAPIVIDYLVETHGISALLVAQVPNDEDWWDTVSKSSYAKIISARHKKPSYATLMADKSLRWPDISTFNGPTVLRWAFGDAIMRPPVDYPKRKPGRSELYEIKPNNPGGKYSALKKLSDVEESYRIYGIAGIYRRGESYPFALSGQKSLTLETPYLALFRYLVTLGLKEFGVTVSRVAIEVTRAEAGALLYKICVDLEGAEKYQKDTAWVMANFAVRMLWRAHNSHASAQVQAAAVVFVESLVPDDASIDPRLVERVIAGRDLGRPPLLKLSPLTIASELSGTLGGIRNAMYSRLIGEPGDLFFLCADEVWYQTNVRLPGAAKVAAQKRLLRFDATRAFTQKSALLGLTQPVVMSADRALGEVPLVGPAYRWAVDHPAETLVIVGCAIVITAAVIVAVGTGGAAAPLSAEVTSAAMATAAGAASAGGEMTGGIMLAAGAAETAIPGTVAVVEEGAAGVRSGVGLVNWARTAMQAGATEAELVAAAEETAGDTFVLKLLAETGVKTVVQAAVKVAPVAAGFALVGLSARPAYAYSGPPDGKVSTANLGELKQLDVGQLHVVRVSRAVRTQLQMPPPLYGKFEIGDYLPTSEVKKVATLYMMGAFEIG